MICTLNNGESAVTALAIPSTFTINVVVDLSSVEAVLVRVLSAFLQITDSQPTESETPAAGPSLPVAVEASAPSPAAPTSGVSLSDPVADRPKRTRTPRAEMAALEAEAAALGISVAALKMRKKRETVLAAEKEGQKAADATAVAQSPPTPAPVAASAPPAPAAQPVQTAIDFDPFGPVPAPAAAAGEVRYATQDEIMVLKKFCIEHVLTNPKAGHEVYTRMRAELGNPLLSGDKVPHAILTALEAKLRTHLASVA